MRGLIQAGEPDEGAVDGGDELCAMAARCNAGTLAMAAINTSDTRRRLLFMLAHHSYGSAAPSTCSKVGPRLADLDPRLAPVPSHVP
ncbi:MAG TPA: hypothetical protein VNO21_02585 [Polyangiaceae bacterium]|nr:hypothetical protein [Polyangiaceae bacterium]